MKPPCGKCSNTHLPLCRQELLSIYSKVVIPSYTPDANTSGGIIEYNKSQMRYLGTEKIIVRSHELERKKCAAVSISFEAIILIQKKC